MLDDAFNAWLIEVNACPSLAADSLLLDRRVKNAMLADAMHLVGVVPYDREVREQSQINAQNRDDPDPDPDPDPDSPTSLYSNMLSPSSMIQADM